MIKIVHCFTDQKFVKCAIDEFEYFNNRCENKYVYITPFRKRKLKYISDLKNIIYLSRFEFPSFLEKEKCDVVILHNLASLPYHIISFIPSHIKVVWFAWGFDIYSSLGYKPLIEVPNLYHRETKNLLSLQLKDRTFTFLKTLCKRLLLWNKKVKRAVSRVDYFSGVFPEEYDMMTQLPFFRARQLIFNYHDPNNEISLALLDSEEAIKGMNIMVGNSADPTNNHADIFMKLKNMHLENRKIFVPFSYAGSLSYKNKIKALGKDFFGDNIIFLENFMEYNEYKKILSSCGIRIFGHERQQAIGNIIMSFRAGCKVFLSKTSIIYKHYVPSGLKICTIQDDFNESEFSKLLDDGETLRNRKISIEMSLTSKVMENLSKLISTLEKD